MGSAHCTLYIPDCHLTDTPRGGHQPRGRERGREGGSSAQQCVCVLPAPGIMGTPTYTTQGNLPSGVLGHVVQPLILTHLITCCWDM